MRIYVYAIWLFILWLFFWSFASVLITRFSGEYSWKTITSVLRGRSECPQCKTKLTAKNLIPLLSYLVQKGKCSHCRKKIPVFYPSIELLSGLVFVLTYLFFPWYAISELVFWIFVNWSLMILIVSDLKYYELNIPVYSVLLVWTLLYLAYPVLEYGFLGLKTVGMALVFWIIFSLAYLGIYYFAKRYAKLRKIWREGEGFGFWDVLFALFAWVMLAVWVHHPSLFDPNIVQGIITILLIYTILSCVLWILYYLVSLLFMPKQKALIPFLPAMIVALRICMLYPNIFSLFTHLLFKI